MDQTYEFEATDEALHWLRVSLLQLRRFVSSFLDFAEAGGSRDATEFTADGHFLLNGVAQAEKALGRAGFPVAEGTSLTVRSLRDVHEHWEQHKRTFESKTSPKSRSGLRFSGAHPDHLPWTFRLDATGTWISALRLEDLWDELVGLERNVTERLQQLASEVGQPGPPDLNSRGPFPRRDSRVLGIAVVTQNIVLDFEPATTP